MGWFRVYDEITDDPKVQNLSDKLFRFWINILALTKRYGGRLPADSDIAFHLRMTEAKVAEGIALLTNREEPFIEQFDRGRRPHNWSGRQYESDSSTERVKKHRQKQGVDVSWNTDGALRETSSESEQKQRQNRTEDSGLPFDTLGKTPEEMFVEEIHNTATLIHDRHPVLRRDIGMGAIEKKLLTICRRHPKSKRFDILREVNQNHEASCAGEGWTKQGGEFAKSLDNWLAPTMERWAVKPSSATRIANKRLMM